MTNEEELRKAKKEVKKEVHDLVTRVNKAGDSILDKLNMCLNAIQAGVNDPEVLALLNQLWSDLILESTIRTGTEAGTADTQGPKTSTLSPKEMQRQIDEINEENDFLADTIDLIARECGIELQVKFEGEEQATTKTLKEVLQNTKKIAEVEIKFKKEASQTPNAKNQAIATFAEISTPILKRIGQNCSKVKQVATNSPSIDRKEQLNANAKQSIIDLISREANKIRQNEQASKSRGASSESAEQIATPSPKVQEIFRLAISTLASALDRPSTSVTPTAQSNLVGRAQGIEK